MQPVTHVDPFTTKDLIDLSIPDQDAEETWPGFVLQTKPQNELLALAETERSRLTELQSNVLKLDLVDLPPLSLNSTTSSPSIPEDIDSKTDKETNIEEEAQEDFWKAPQLLVSGEDNKLISWDHFNTTGHVEPQQTLLSEAAPATFDLLLRKVLPRTHNDDIKYAQPDVLIRGLIDASVGRSSILFQWSDQAQRFEVPNDNFTMSGLSHNTLRTIITMHLDAGAQFRRLKQFGRSRHGQTPVRISLQTATNAVIDVVEETVEQSRHSIRSLIQLQNTYILPLLLLIVLDQLARAVRSITKDSDLISAILTFAENALLEAPQFEQIMHMLVLRTLKPVLGAIEAEIGLALTGKICQVKDEVFLALLDPSALRMLQQTRSAFQVLQSHDFDHLIFSIHQSSHNKLKVEYNLENIVQLQKDAELYERRFQELVISRDKSCPTHEDSEGSKIGVSAYPTGEQQPFVFDSSIFSDTRPPSHGTGPIGTKADSSLHHVVSSALVAETNNSVNIVLSCRQAIDLSISRLLRAQHRLLSYSVLQIMFIDYKLVYHAELLGRFQLLTDGTFVSKLSMSLFEAEQVSGEVSQRLHTKTGLRLQSRETWPPASSELRLALMGILSESMANIQDTTLTDSVSFAIRDLSDEDLERCRDIDSIYALDFLRLNYKPPNSVLEAVMTSDSLETYDKIFNQLLRLLRMKSLTQSMLYSVRTKDKKATTIGKEHKFRLEAQWFISAIAEYYQGTVIKSNWLAFETRLNQIAAGLERKDYTKTLELAGSLDHLRELHEEVLDKIMRGLLLKRRQSEPKGIIDRLFAVVLRFAAMTSKGNSLHTPAASGRTNDNDNDNDSTTTTTISRLRKDFEMHMKALVRWLKTESGRTENDSSEMFEQLLLKLDWNGYWSR